MSNIQARIESLSPEKQRLLALRLGIKQRAKANTNKTTLAAFVTADNTVDDVALRSHLKNHLPSYMIPTHITLVDDIPRTPNGKVDRRALENSLVQTNDAPETPVTQEIADDIEAQLISIWEELLNIDYIEPTDDFFELGGYSLLAIRMFAKINELFEVDLPLSILMEAPTITQLAEKIRNQDNLSDILIPVRSEGDKAPLYIFQVNKFGVIHYNQLIQLLDNDRPIYGVTQSDFDEDNERSFVELADHFAQAILSNQPQGPYYFLGLSVAGLVAYEVARNLKERGVDDVHVIMFDTYGPDYPENIPTTKAIGQKIGVFTKQFVAANADEKQFLIRDMVWQLKYRSGYRFRRIKNRLRRRLGLHVEISERDQLNIGGAAITKHYFAYFAEEHRGNVPILLYRSQLQPLNANYAPSLHWDRYIPEEYIEVKPVTGAHTSLLRDSVDAIASHFQAWLADKD